MQPANNYPPPRCAMVFTAVKTKKITLGEIRQRAERARTRKHGPTAPPLTTNLLNLHSSSAGLIDLHAQTPYADYELRATFRHVTKEAYYPRTHRLRALYYPQRGRRRNDLRNTARICA